MSPYNANLSIISLFKRLWGHLTRRRRTQFGLLFLLMILCSFAEVISISALFPFLSILSAPDKIYELPSIQIFIQLLGLNTSIELLFFITVLFALSALIAGAMRLLLLWTSTKLSYALGADISILMFRRTLYQPYIIHCSRNSSKVIDGISQKSKGVVTTINMFLLLLSSCIMLVVILTALLVLDPKVALIAFGSVGIIYFVILMITRRRLNINSKRIAYESSQLIKILQEGLGGIRDILISGSQELYCKIYSKSDIAWRNAASSNAFISGSPRYIMEAFGMMIISVLAYSLAGRPDNITNAIPILGVFALGAQRLLPVIQQGYSALSNIQGGHASFRDVIELLDQPLPYPENLTKLSSPELLFNRSITLEQIGFRYSDTTPYIFKNINLSIGKGSRLGVVGPTGSGKSTIVDILMGLHIPTEGKLMVDQQKIDISNYSSWQARIAHVPQSIFLLDATIEENIAFGICKEQVDSERVKLAAKRAQIADVIESWPDKYHTIVGEFGIRLSGGQRQRIGIARALYKQADLIVLDEATSALDDKTEEAVMRAIEGLDKDLTLIIIAHRISTLKNCTQIIKLDNGVIDSFSSYNELTDQPFVKEKG